MKKETIVFIGTKLIYDMIARESSYKSTIRWFFADIENPNIVWNIAGLIIKGIQVQPGVETHKNFKYIYDYSLSRIR